MPEYPNPKLRSVPSPPASAERDFSAPAYAELDVTSNFSFLRGASHADELVFRAAELGYRAIAITDRNTLCGVVRMHEAAKQANLKLLVGTRLCFVDAPDILAWPTDRAAYARLCRLLTIGKRRAEKGGCHLYLDDLLEHCQGLTLAIVPDIPKKRDSPVFQLRDAVTARHLSLAASCGYDGRDQQRLAALHDLSRQTGVPLVATNAVHYHDPSRRALQDALTCIRHGCTIQDAGFKLFANAERYLKSPAQMHQLFSDYPQALRRTIEIAEQCDFSLDELRYEYPDELVPPGSSPIQYLSDLSYGGAAARYPDGVPEKIHGLIEHELKLIEQLHYEAYFLTVHDLVKFARSRGILCQGRGSAANSAVCYCLGVTSVDPARIDLLFERFISAARGEPPDIDIDFEHERREEVIQYIYEKYGRERAGMTAEVITYRGRSAVRDVGKAMGLSLDLVGEMAKKLDWWDRGTISEQRLREIGLDPTDRTVRLIIELTSQLLGFPRHLSQHVGGMVMTRGPLCEMIPIENASMPDRTVIEWDKDDIDAVGILKVDVLGLGMLTCLSKSFRMVNEQQCNHRDTETTAEKNNNNEFSVAASALSAPLRLHSLRPIELHTIPDDPAVYDMICDADTVGVFQIESRAQMSMLPRLRPRNFYDLVIEVAIVRPGPIQGDMVHPYLRRRDGIEPVEYPSEALRRVLEKTLGVPLFQEQAMKIAMVGAGFTAEEADQLRRAMAAWKRHGALDRFHRKIVDGMLKNGYSEEFAERCFHQIKGFGEYGFPESHAASFALLVYASAWIKRHHPAAFAAALLNSQPMGFYAPAQIVRDAREHGVRVWSVDVNHSDWDCTLEKSDEATKRRSDEGKQESDEECATRNLQLAINSSLIAHRSALKFLWGLGGPAVRLGFRQVKGLSNVHAQRIVRARQKCGAFTSVAQIQRSAALPRHVMQRLAHADAFGSLGLSRREALWHVLALEDDPAPLFASHALDEPPVKLPKMPIGQEVLTDYETGGLSLKLHPMALLREELRKRKIVCASELANLPAGRWVKVAGLVLIRQRPGTASGIVFETLEDETGIVNLIVRPNIYDQYRAAARHAAVLQADGYVERQGKVIHVMVKRMFDLSELLEGYRARSRDFH